MKITKLGHSCVLVEVKSDTPKITLDTDLVRSNEEAFFSGGNISKDMATTEKELTSAYDESGQVRGLGGSGKDWVGLFDAGGWADRGLIDAVNHVDRIIYTHEHGDHFDIEILKSLATRFPNAHVICNTEIQKLIENAEIDIVVRNESQCTVAFDSPHEQPPIPGAVAPAETGYHFKDIFTHPGDSQHFSVTKKVLAMPFIGPWGKTGDSIAKVLELKPEFVLPVHDWHYTPEAKVWLQGLLESAFEGTGIKLLPNENGKVIEL